MCPNLKAYKKKSHPPKTAQENKKTPKLCKNTEPNTLAPHPINKFNLY